jgi:hypothetical protein
MPELRSRARTAPVWLYGRLLRDAAGFPDSTRVQRRRYRFGGGCLQANLALSARPGSADSQLDGGGAINVGHGLNELITFTRQSEDELLPTHPWISWHEPTADPDCESWGRAALPLQVLHAPLHPTGDAAAVIAGPGGPLLRAQRAVPGFHRASHCGASRRIQHRGDGPLSGWRCQLVGVGGSSGRAVARGLLNRT